MTNIEERYRVASSTFTDSSPPSFSSVHWAFAFQSTRFRGRMLHALACLARFHRLHFSLSFALMVLIARLASCGDCTRETVLTCASSPEWLWSGTKPFIVESAIDVSSDAYDDGAALTGEEIAGALVGGQLQMVGERTFVLEWQQGGADWRVTVDASDVAFVHTFRYWTETESYSERRCGYE